MLRIILSDVNNNPDGRGIFIDRDGVINQRRPGDYVLDWSQFIFVPGIRQALKQLSSLGMPMILISNQAAIGKGLLAPGELEDITFRLHKTLCADGTFLAAAYFCPHRPDEMCICRKPEPGLLLSAACDFNIDLSRSVFIGDSETDVQAARSAGCKPVLFDSSNHARVGISEWQKNLAIAAAPAELFDIALRCLEF